MQCWKCKIRKEDYDFWRGFEESLETLRPFLEACLKEPKKFYLLPRTMRGPDGLLIVVVCLFFGQEDFKRIYRGDMLSQISAKSQVGQVIRLYQKTFDKLIVPFSVFFACYPTDEKTASIVRRYQRF